MVFRTKMDMAQWLPKPDESLFEYWTSFSPMAPMLGVPWRFAEGRSGSTTKQTMRPRTVTRPTLVKEPVAEVAPKSTPKPTPKPGPAPKAAKPAPKTAKPAAAAPKPKAATSPSKPAPVAADPKPKAPAAPVAKQSKPKPAAPRAKKPAAPAPVPDDLTVIKGIGPKMAQKLADKGIVSYAQIAKWRKPTVAKMDAELGGIPGAIERSDWVGQAKALIG